MQPRSFFRTSGLSAVLTALLGISACTTTLLEPAPVPDHRGRDPDRLLIVDCLLPGQIHRLGRNITFVTPRRPTKVSASECEIRGGEYVAYDRANFATSLKVWLPKAQTGDLQAQTLVGEIFEKGLGQEADPTIAAEWYRKAAAQGYSRALINLGYLYESGLGVERDLTRAMNLYRQAAGINDGNLEYVTSVQVAAREQQASDNSDLRQEVEKVNSRLVSEREAFAQLQSEYIALEQQADSIRSELTLSENKPENKTDISALLSELQALKQQLANSETESTRLVSELESQQRQTGSLRQRASAASKQLYDAQDELAAHTSRVSDLEQKLADQRAVADASNSSHVKELEKQLESSVSAEAVLQQQVEELKKAQTTESDRLRTKLQEAERQENLLVLDLGRTRNTLSELQLTLESKDSDYRKELEALLQSKSGLQNSVQQQRLTIDNLENKIAEIKDNSNNQQTADAANSERLVSELQSELDSARAELKRKTIEQHASEENQIVALSTVENELDRHRARLKAQQKELERLQLKEAEEQAKQKVPQMDQVSTDILAGPEIEIIEPPQIFRDEAIVIPVNSTTNSIELIGRVSPVENLFTLSVDGERKEYNENGIFRHVAPVDFSSQLAFSAVDKAGVRVAIDVKLEPRLGSAQPPLPTPLPDVSQVDFGEYHALIIGNGSYGAMPSIDTAINDATEMARTLENRFGFKTELILDADRFEILAALNRKRDELTKNDNLVIYFTGHSKIGNGKGYWLPVDANPSDMSTWISNVSIAAMIDSISAKHIMVVADSVFLGTMSRNAILRIDKNFSANQRLMVYKSVANLKTRTVLTSGAATPFTVSSLTSNHSVFTSGVLEVLKSSGPDVLFAYDLFAKVREQLLAIVSPTGTSLVPRYAPIKYAGHENGEFLFVPTESRIGHNSITLPSYAMQTGQESLLKINAQ